MASAISFSANQVALHSYKQQLEKSIASKGLYETEGESSVEVNAPPDGGCTIF